MGSEAPAAPPTPVQLQGTRLPLPQQACHHARHLWYQAPKQCVIPRTLSSLILAKMGRSFSRH